MLKVIMIPREDLIELVKDYILSYEGDYIDDIEDIDITHEGLEVSYETEGFENDDE